MELFFDIKTRRRLAVTIMSLPKDVTRVYAAIAYTHDDSLLNKCIESRIQLEWWGLFNSDNATDYELVKKAISSEHVTFYPFANLFHPKVIYFENYGIYIGSANMTRSALRKNVEAGVFIKETELDEKMKIEITSFFSTLRDNSIPATIDDIDRIQRFLDSTQNERDSRERLSSHIKNNFMESLGHLFLLKPGSEDFGKKQGSKTSNQRLLFTQEWRETQNHIQIVKDTMVDTCSQPKWIASNAHPTVITDQLLHAYYYTYVLKGKDDRKSVEAVEKYYNKNKASPGSAILEAIRWWESLPAAPSNEDTHINTWGLSNLNILNYLTKRDLSVDEFITVMKQNHAARNHARQIRNDYFDLPPNYRTDIEERTILFAKKIFFMKSASGKNINDIMRYILFNDDILLEERIYNAIFDINLHIDHFGRSIIGELAGWGRPDITHLRNNRVNKALRCLGFDVPLFSE